jgi:hypothetical protein
MAGDGAIEAPKFGLQRLEMKRENPMYKPLFRVA